MKESTASTSVSMKGLLQAAVIFVAVWWIYWPALHGDWLRDDNIDVAENDVIHSASGLWSIWFSPGALLDYYPVKATVQWVQWHLWGNDTLGYHVTNVALHSLGALLVWKVFGKFNLRSAWLGGLIFAIHPVQVESVAWIAELKNTLSLPLFLLAICFYLDYDEHHRRSDYLFALILFLVAMLCKPGMVMFPVIILLYAWWKRGRIGVRDLQASAPFFIISLILGLMALAMSTWYAQLHRLPMEAVPAESFGSRMAIAGLSLSFYVAKSLFPINLLPLYSKWSLGISAALPWVVLALVIYLLWIKRESWGRHILLGLGFFLINLAPFVFVNMGGFTRYTWVMDHFLYLPIIGLIGLAVAGLDEVHRRLPKAFRSLGIGILVGVMALLAWESRAYAGIYLNEEALWNDLLQRAPGYAVAHNNVGNILLQNDQASAALEQFEQAAKLDPTLVEAPTSAGVALAKLGRFPEAIAQFRVALAIDPAYFQAREDLGNALFQTNQLSEAVTQYEEALRLNPNDAAVLDSLGLAYLKLGRSLDAMQAFHSALESKPEDADYHFHLGNALVQANQLPDAVAQYQEALRLKPDYAEAHNNCGLALARMGMISLAMDQFQKALRLKPDYALAQKNLTTLQSPKTNISGKK